MLSGIVSGRRFDMHLAVPRLLVRRSIMLLVSVALLAMTLIGLAGMGASFLVVDRSGPGHNCDEVQLDRHGVIEAL